MKVAIASCYYHHNYGSMLQAYATQKILDKLGYEVTTICCEQPITYMTQPKWKYYFHKLSDMDIVKKKIRQYSSKMQGKSDMDFKQGKALRSTFFNGFYSEKTKLSSLLKTRVDLTEFANKMDAVVVGSDMLWHPINVEHDFYTLTFVPENVKKIAYATSFGTTEVPKYQLDIYRNFLNRFDAISVREQSGVELISKLSVNKPVKVVLDPTLLFTGQEWMEIQESEPKIKEKYIFCYFLGVNREHREFAIQLKKLTGYKIVVLKHLDEYILNDAEFGDISPYDVGPAEFVNLIRNAEFVCTDSFHGTCFSILNHKKFFTFNRFMNGNTQSTNTRIDSLLGMLGLEDRRINNLYDEGKMTDILEKEIDYTVVENKLAIIRKDSIDYLKTALDN